MSQLVTFKREATYSAVDYTIGEVATLSDADARQAWLNDDVQFGEKADSDPFAGFANSRREAVVDLPSVAAGAEAAVTVTGIDGATVNKNGIVAAPPASFVASGLRLVEAYVSAADEVTLVVSNPTAGAVDAASATWRFLVLNGAVGAGQWVPQD